MRDYLVAIAFTLLVSTVPILIAGQPATYIGLILAALVYVGFGLFNFHYAYSLLKRLDRLSKEKNHPVARQMVNKIVNNEKVIENLLEGMLSGILCIVLAAAGYFYLPFTVVAVAAACFFMLKSSNMIDMVGAEIKKQ